MHEYSLAQALVERVEREALARGATAVYRVTVRIGPLAGVEPELLVTAYGQLRVGTLCAGPSSENGVAPAWPSARRDVSVGAPLTRNSATVSTLRSARQPSKSLRNDTLKSENANAHWAPEPTRAFVLPMLSLLEMFTPGARGQAAGHMPCGRRCKRFRATQRDVRAACKRLGAERRTV